MQNNNFENQFVPGASFGQGFWQPLQSDTSLYTGQSFPQSNNSWTDFNQSAPSNESVAEPTCPNCNSAMKLRSTKNDPNKKFYGCTNYPNCNGIIWMNQDGSLKTWTSYPPKNDNPSPSYPTESSVSVPNNQPVKEIDEELAKRIAAKRLNIYNNNCALQSSVAEFEDKKRMKKTKRLFFEFAPVDPASKSKENKTYLWGKDKNTKKSISLDYEECVSLFSLLLGKAPAFKIFHDPFAKTANAWKANSAMTANWQSEQVEFKYNNGQQDVVVPIVDNTIRVWVSIKKLWATDRSNFNFKLSKNDILYLKSLCMEIISHELELPETVVYEMIKDNF